MFLFCYTHKHMNLATIISYTETHGAIFLAIAVAIILLYVIYLHHKIHRFTRGENGASLETLMKQCVDSVAEIQNRNELISKHALSLDARMNSALRNAQMIRYKAFEANGSNQSFSIALLNDQGHGVIITSLHARDRISTFAKPITGYTSEHDLTEEELSVIEESKKAHVGSR